MIPKPAADTLVVKHVTRARQTLYRLAACVAVHADTANVNLYGSLVDQPGEQGVHHAGGECAILDELVEARQLLVVFGRDVTMLQRDQEGYVGGVVGRGQLGVLDHAACMLSFLSGNWVGLVVPCLVVVIVQ